MRAIALPVAVLAAIGTSFLITAEPRMARAAPEVNYLFPGGGQRGTTVEVTAGGTFPEWPVGVWTSNPQVSVTPLQEKGKLSVEIEPAALTGTVWLRLFDRQGAAAPRPWMIGAATEVSEQEPNDRAVATQHVSLEAAPHHTVTVNGRLQKAGDADVYSLSARAGQTLVADLDAQAMLAAPFDGVLQVLDSAGFVVAHNDDHHQLDPHLAVEVASDGRWLVRVFGFPETPSQQVELAGNDAYVYRLTLSTGPVVNYSLPLAAHRDLSNRWQMVGWNLTDELRQLSLPSPRDCAEFSLGESQFGRTIRLPVVDCPLLVESEPNSVADPAQVKLPINITGRLDTADDRDVFQFESLKGETVLIKIESQKLGYPLDAVLEVLDASENRLVRVDDVSAGRDAQTAYQVAEDGPLRVIVSDLYGHGGSDYVYRLSLERAKPSYSLSTEFHQVVLKAGETTELKIDVERSHGFSDPIEVRVDSLPNGVTALPATSKVDDDSETATQVAVPLTAGNDAVSAAIRVFGEAAAGNSTAAHFETPGWPSGLKDVWLTIVPQSD